MEKEYCVQRLTDVVISSEREAEIAYSSADMCSFEILSNPLRSTYKVESIAVVLFYACSYSEYIRVEDDVQRVHPHLFGEYLVCPFGDSYSAFECRCLSFFVETHHYDGSTEPHCILSVTNENLFAFL